MCESRSNVVKMMFPIIFCFSFLFGGVAPFDDATNISTTAIRPAATKCPVSVSPDCQCSIRQKDLFLQCYVGGNYENVFVSEYKVEGGLLVFNCPCNNTGPQLVTSALFDYLPEVSLSDVSTVKLQFCPLSPSNIAALLNKWTNASSIQRLYLRSCQPLPSIEEGYFNQLEALTHLHLQFNYLTSLPNGLFKNLSNLKELWISDNLLDSLGRTLFENLTTLLSLQLGNNRIRHLESNIFARLKNLVQLNLQKNAIKHIPENLLQPLSHLSILDLSNNGIEKLDENMFQFNAKLTEVGLDLNRFPLLPSGLFRNAKSLIKLRLYGNKNLSSLSSDVFQALTVLEVLNISECMLNHSSIASDAFKNLNKLRILILASNRIAHLNPQWFSGLSSLTELDLSGNQLTIIESDCFTSNRKLTTLKLENNYITEIKVEAMEPLKALTHVYLSKNNLTFSEGLVDPVWGMRQSPLQNNLGLKVIDLSHNFITDFMSDWFNMNFLSHLKLNHNSITTLEFGDLQFSNDIIVDVQNNKITKIDFKKALELDVGKENERRKTLHVNGNPLNCNCDTFYFAQYLNRLLPGLLYSWTIKAETLICQQPESLKNMKPTSVDPSLFVCSCGQEFSPCTCIKRYHDSTTLLNCQQQNLTIFPPRLPSLVGYKLQLNFSSNYIDFERLPSLGSTGSSILDPHTNVSSLDLSNNGLNSTIFESNWWISLPLRFPSLHRLDLSKNNLTLIPSGIVQHWNATPDLTLLLANNPWSCDCNNRLFFEFLFSLKRNQVKDFDQMACKSGKMFSTLTFNDICPIVSTLLKVVSIVIPLFALLILLSFFIIFRYRRVFRAWLYNRGFCLWWVTKKEEEDDRDYDAFISYSHLDEDFVINELVPVLERPNSGQPDFRLCLHYRDWYLLFVINLFLNNFFSFTIYFAISFRLAGEWIPDQISRSVRSSKRTIVILSENFLESLWGQLEFRTAYEQVLKDKCMRLIIIVKDELPTKEKMDEDLKNYLSLNTYLKWGDPWFWHRLR